VAVHGEDRPSGDDRSCSICGAEACVIALGKFGNADVLYCVDHLPV